MGPGVYRMEFIQSILTSVAKNKKTKQKKISSMWLKVKFYCLVNCCLCLDGPVQGQLTAVLGARTPRRHNDSEAPLWFSARFQM